jgi:hypothetical protein
MELWEMYGKGEITKDFLMSERFRYPLAKMGLVDCFCRIHRGKQYWKFYTEQTALFPFARELGLSLFQNIADTYFKRIW